MAKRQCEECFLKWETDEMLIPEEAEKCPACQAEIAELRADNLGKSVDAMDRRIKFLERQVEGLEKKTPDGWPICLSCRKPVLPKMPVQVVQGGVIHEQCEEAFRRRIQGKVTCTECEGTGRCRACGGSGAILVHEDPR
jgi:hypothetical protein